MSYPHDDPYHQPYYQQQPAGYSQPPPVPPPPQEYGYPAHGQDYGHEQDYERTTPNPYEQQHHLQPQEPGYFRPPSGQGHVDPFATPHVEQFNLPQRESHYDPGYHGVQQPAHHAIEMSEYPYPDHGVQADPAGVRHRRYAPSIDHESEGDHLHAGYKDTADDDGGIPLLPRQASDRSFTPSRNDMPGAYDPAYGDGDGGQAGEWRKEEELPSNIRFGRIPQRVPRRYKTIKRVELYHGNYVYDAAVPSKLLALCANRTEREFTHLRYTGATCDPNDFLEEGFTLRQVLYDPPRRTELFIVLTMYNEDEVLFCRTMHGVIKNIAHLCTRERSKTWGKEGWKKVVVCIVSDGRQKINSRTLSAIAAMGAYQDGIAKNQVNNKEVTAHLYEYTTQISVNKNMKIEGAERGTVPVQILFCLKEKNQKKINSHRWFFNAFGPILQPNVCVLLDVGTQPGPTSIYHLWKAFDINSNVGGACGEIVADKGKWHVMNLLNPLVAAQNFEYKMSNILDKPLESIFGYITVLPGAFSAYRYIALQNDPKGEGPLQKYFLGEKMHGADADIFTANMYLAEDRILCWELVSKRGGSWILHYVKSAYAVTDVPDQVPELISQRRRWLNGSFFAAIHSTVKFKYLYRSSHSFTRKFWIHVELFYQTYNLLFSWFALGNFYISFIILSQSMEELQPPISIHIPNLIMQFIYLGLLVMCFILSLGNRPQGSKWAYTIAMIGFATITIYMTFAAFFLAVRGAQDIAKNEKDGHLSFSDIFTEPKFGQIVLSIMATLGLYILASLLFFEPWHMVTSFLQYLLLAPSYVSVLNVYAFSNVHDISWGTKGDNKVATDLGVVKTSKTDGKEAVDTEVPTDEKDINAAYDDALHVLSTKPPKQEDKVDDKTKQEDYYKTFRTNVLLAWTLSNGLLAVAITSFSTSQNNTEKKFGVYYMEFVLWSVVFLAFFRFIGSTSYMIVRLFAGE